MRSLVSLYRAIAGLLRTSPRKQCQMPTDRLFKVSGHTSAQMTAMMTIHRIIGHQRKPMIHLAVIFAAERFCRNCQQSVRSSEMQVDHSREQFVPLDNCADGRFRDSGFGNRIKSRIQQ